MAAVVYIRLTPMHVSVMRQLLCSNAVKCNMLCNILIVVHACCAEVAEHMQLYCNRSSVKAGYLEPHNGDVYPKNIFLHRKPI